RPPYVRTFKPGFPALADEQCRTLISSGLQIPLDPIQSPLGKKYRALFSALADNLGLCRVEINLAPVQRKHLADPHGASQKGLDQGPEAQAGDIGGTLAAADLDGMDKTLDLLGL